MKIWLDGRLPPPKGFKWIKTSWEAIELLKTGKCEYISLDYDLGNLRVCGDGYMVACWIEGQVVSRKMKKRVMWECHTRSIIGKRIIESALRHADAVWDNFI